jgi:hypothetical protein
VFLFFVVTFIFFLGQFFSSTAGGDQPDMTAPPEREDVIDDLEEDGPSTSEQASSKLMAPTIRYITDVSYGVSETNSLLN